MRDTIEQALRRSLDNDLISYTEDRQVSLELAMLVQIVRLMRGRSLPVVETPIEGWTPDGNKWYPSQPGTTVTVQTKNSEQK